MASVMPQEIEVWYLIPALRRELAKILVREYGISQKNVGEMLGTTGAAISQYLSMKRGNEIKFSKEELELIKKSARNIAKDPREIMRKIYSLSVSLRKTKAICGMHIKHDKSLSKGCDICFK